MGRYSNARSNPRSNNPGMGGRRFRADCLSSIEPHVHQARAEAEAVDVSEALDVRRVRDVPRPHRQIDIVGLVGEITLNLVNDFASLAILGSKYGSNSVEYRRATSEYGGKYGWLPAAAREARWRHPYFHPYSAVVSDIGP
jgi:hypothetical protein